METTTVTMKTAKVNGSHLEYEERGTGEPVLLIPNGPFASSFLSFMSAHQLADGCRLIRYHQRGQAGSSGIPGSTIFADHAADAAALLRYLEVGRAHVVGHSTGAIVALQLAADYPTAVATLTLLEPPLVAAAGAAEFFKRAEPALAAYGSGNREAAMARFLSTVSGLDWHTCRTVLERHTPGSVAQAMLDADNLFTSLLPGLSTWAYGAHHAAAFSRPVLSVTGARTDPWFVASHDLLASWFSKLEHVRVKDAGHLLQMEQPEPVADAIGRFIARNPIGSHPA